MSMRHLIRWGLVALFIGVATPALAAGPGGPTPPTRPTLPTAGQGRTTAVSAPGSTHRSATATEKLRTSIPTLPNGVTPGQGKTTAGSTPGAAKH